MVKLALACTPNSPGCNATSPTETAKHHFFASFPVSVAPKHSLIVIPSDSDALFGTLSSRLHTAWALAKGGRL